MANWWKRGFFAAGGWHPLAAQIRRTVNQPETLEDDFFWNHSEERVRHLAECGIELIIDQFDRGLGDSDAAPAHEAAARLASLCHRYGIRHGVYLANSVYYESMLKDEPECEDYIIRNAQGGPAYYGGEQTFRWIVCFNSESWRKRMKRIIRKAILEVKTDLLHFDNLAVWPEPDACRCRYCREKFIRYLEQCYPDAESQIARFGFTGFKTFRIPEFYTAFQPAWSFERFSNPLIQDFIDFRCKTVTDYIRDMASYARELNPDIVIDSNGQFIGGENRAFLYGTDAAGQTPWVEIICNENADYRPDPDPDRVPPVIVKLRGFRQARQKGKAVFSAFRDEEQLAFNLAFGGSPGIFVPWGYAEGNHQERTPLPDGIRQLLDFYRRNREWFGLQKLDSRIAVWRSTRSLRYISGATHLAAAVTEQLLINRRLPFTIVTEEELGACPLLIIPAAEYLSAEEEQTITELVRNGMSLLLLGPVGIYNGKGRRRTREPFMEIFGNSAIETRNQEQAVFDSSRQFGDRDTASPDPAAVSYGKTGRGRAIWIRKLACRHQPFCFESRYNCVYRGIDSRYWKEPGNAEEILSAIRSLLPPGEIPEFTGGKDLFVEYLEKGIFYFRSGTGSPGLPPEEIQFRWPGAERCSLLSPDRQEETILSPSENGVFRFTAGRIGIIRKME